MEDDLRKIYKHFGGYEKQKAKLAEEAKEYIESGEAEEIADLFVLATQFYLENKEIRQKVRYKINRTLKRMESKYYEGAII